MDASLGLVLPMTKSKSQSQGMILSTMKLQVAPQFQSITLCCVVQGEFFFSHTDKGKWGGSFPPQLHRRAVEFGPSARRPEGRLASRDSSHNSLKQISYQCKHKPLSCPFTIMWRPRVNELP